MTETITTRDDLYQLTDSSLVYYPHRSLSSALWIKQGGCLIDLDGRDKGQNWSIGTFNPSPDYPATVLYTPSDEDRTRSRIIVEAQSAND